MAPRGRARAVTETRSLSGYPDSFLARSVKNAERYGSVSSQSILSADFSQEMGSPGVRAKDGAIMRDIEPEARADREKSMFAA